MGAFPPGILNVIKPPGPTSHDVVARIRRFLPRKTRVGHAGTLDPAAAGVLIVMVGAATRLSPYLTGRPKVYRAEIVFGLETDTCDAEGEVTAVHPAGRITASRLEQALAAFTGTIEQVPPATSAIKVGGVPLHRRTRRGELVEPPPRRVAIYSLRLIRWYDDEKHPRAVIDVHCGPGTYIRSLARDLGRHLGCGAMLGFLLRLGSGSMTVDEGITLEELPRREEAAAAAARGGLLIPMARAMDFLPGVILSDGEVEAVVNGRPLAPRPRSRWDWVPAVPDGVPRADGGDGGGPGRRNGANGGAGRADRAGDARGGARSGADGAGGAEAIAPGARGARSGADGAGGAEGGGAGNDVGGTAPMGEDLVRLLDREGRLAALARPRRAGPAAGAEGERSAIEKALPGEDRLGFAPRRVFPR